MHPNAQILRRFYTAFSALDPDSMAQCNSSDVRFRDAVFELQGQRDVMGMWRMLCEAVHSHGRADWKLEFSVIAADAAGGKAHWDARYRFSGTGRMVLNRIDAAVRFDAQGRIVDHTDSFDFWRWSRQALGAPGLLLGWTPLLRQQVRARAATALRKYVDAHP